jgi:hypothetical protein
MIMVIAVFRPDGLMSLFRTLSIGNSVARRSAVQIAAPLEDPAPFKANQRMTS